MSDATIIVSSKTAEHFKDLPLDADADGKLRALLEAEYRRRLSRYNLVDRSLRKKYGMSFSDFERNKMVEQQEFSWSVESDAIEWDLASSGIRTMQRKLAELTE